MSPTDKLLLLAGSLLAAAGCNRDHDAIDAPPEDSMVAVVSEVCAIGESADFGEMAKQKPGAVPLHPQHIFLYRADPNWRQADEIPSAPVRLSAFAIDRHEVTNARYRVFIEARSDGHRQCHPDEPEHKDHTPRYWHDDFNPRLKTDALYARTAPFSLDTFRADDKPVVGVDWYDAYAYCAWEGGRLPTEAEWERAARGCDGRRWPWGDTWRWGMANIGGEKRGGDVPGGGREKDGWIYVAPVGSFPDGRSPSGVEDMAGNAAEWVADWYAADSYARLPSHPTGPAAGEEKVVRGGSTRSGPSGVRAAKRDSREPEYRAFDLGFRCAR